MPSRFARRRRFGSRFSGRSRRRFNVRRRRPQRLRRRRFQRAPRSRVFRRFKRRFTKRRRTRRLSRKALEFRLSDLKPSVQSFGQQHSVPDDNPDPECVYFTTEATVTTHTARTETTTRSLGGITDVVNTATYSWQNVPISTVSSPYPGWVSDTQWGSLYLKGRDMYHIRNQSNERIQLVSYTCVARKDYNFVRAGLNPNVYNYLGNGFAENGYGVTVADADNPGMIEANMTPFHSRLFCRLFKIVKVRNHRIGPGQVLRSSLKYPWRRHTPVDLTVTPATAQPTNWASRETRFTVLRGERFILWKLIANPAGVAGQTTLERNITQTTPTVIMRTIRRLWSKHMPRPQQPLSFLTSFGMAEAGATGSIIVDSDEVKGNEMDAS